LIPQISRPSEYKIMTETRKKENRKKAQNLANVSGNTIVFFFSQGMPFFISKDNIGRTSEYKDAEFSEEFQPVTIPQN
jgi:hypothetical protein